MADLTTANAELLRLAKRVKRLAILAYPVGCRIDYRDVFGRESAGSVTGHSFYGGTAGCVVEVRKDSGGSEDVPLHRIHNGRS